MIMIGDNKFIN